MFRDNLSVPSLLVNKYKKDCLTRGEETDILSRNVVGYQSSAFGGLGVSALASDTQVRGFKPGGNRRIFQGEKNPQRAFLRKGIKTVGPMSLIYGM
jgi:hypothetical protein